MVNAFRWMIFVIGLAVIIGSIMVTSAGEPLIAIYSPSDGDTVDTDTIAVFGGAMSTEGTIVESVTVNGDLAEGTTSWRKLISLQPGPNEITVVATDNMWQSRSKTISVTYIASTPYPGPTTPPPLYTTIPTGGPRPTPTPIPMPTGSISITTTPPSGAKILLDGVFKGNTPITLEDVVGNHEIEISKARYRSEIRYIDLYEGITKKLNIELKPVTGSIAVFSTPSGASVYLDDVDMNKTTPCMLNEVLVGQHTIMLTKSGYFDVTKVSVYEGKTTRLDVNLTSGPKYGSIGISSHPSGADVYLDGNYTGETTPANISTVALANHTIKLTKSGYFDVIIRNVSVSVGETIALHENLTGYGSISISSYPSGANVFVDGNYTGKTPLDIPKVVEGWHSIKLTRLDYADVEEMIYVSAGQPTRVGGTLSVPEAEFISK